MNTHTMKYRSCVIIIALFAFAAGMQAQNPIFDLFPLEKGLRFTYEYKDRYSSVDCCSSQSEQDSGIIEYYILDSSSINDTTVYWHARMSRSILHEWLYPYHSTYPIIDSTIITITEIITGNHELQVSSYIWDFPASSGGTPCPIFRFADSTNSLISLNSSWYPYDSLWFTSDSGLIKRDRYLDDFFYLDEGHASWLICHLVSRVKVSVENHDLLPAQSVLFPNYPNPANPTTTISYELATSSDVVLAVYDILGRRIATIAEGIQQPGKHQFKYDASNIGSGIYIVRLQAPGFTRSNKLVIIK